MFRSDFMKKEKKLDRTSMASLDENSLSGVSGGNNKPELEIGFPTMDFEFSLEEGEVLNSPNSSEGLNFSDFSEKDIEAMNDFMKDFGLLSSLEKKLEQVRTRYDTNSP